MFILNYSTIVDPLLRDIRIYTPEFAGMKAGDRVLDVCCGTGEQAFYYARRGIIVIGTDRNPNMLKLAKRNQRKRGLSNVSFQMADAQNLPFKDNFFDFASISFALHENERTAIDRIISEMKRVVRKGGTLILLDFRVPLPNGLFFYFVNAIEFLAGKNNYKCFRDYIEQGGLDSILKRNQLPEGKRDNLSNRLLTIIKTRNV